MWQVTTFHSSEMCSLRAIESFNLLTFNKFFQVPETLFGFYHISGIFPSLQISCRCDGSKSYCQRVKMITVSI